MIGTPSPIFLILVASSPNPNPRLSILFFATILSFLCKASILCLSSSRLVADFDWVSGRALGNPSGITRIGDYSIGRLDLSGEVVEEGLPVGEGDGGDAESASVLDVVGVLEVVVGDEVDEGLKRVAARVLRVLGAVGGLDGSWE
ncbi:phosphatidylinositol-4-phosphate 5-kinase family protein [Striga asiatica]|uniref:Phosphatidylinositol-4-phosphate 5-kinase family protein n=1 Tax=Striga asiatica TaxID=4170 RepID=A0A5A7PMY8_STRAF|nr:phosphatidylinositol-4-phosphate 5-kinase family protein [Striga asiatica]